MPSRTRTIAQPLCDMKKNDLRHLTFILTLLVASCTSDRTYNQDDRLLDWTSEFVMEDGEQADGYYQDHDNFIKSYFTTHYKVDTLIVTTLIEINSCAEIIADVKISNDTLYLLTKDIGDVACASVIFNKFTYIIHNPNNKRFIIKSEK